MRLVAKALNTNAPLGTLRKKEVLKLQSAKDFTTYSRRGVAIGVKSTIAPCFEPYRFSFVGICQLQQMRIKVFPI